MGKQGAELRWWDQSSSSTVLLDPAALVESCKQQIQGKDGIPAEHQRLIFACRVANQEVLSYTCKRSSRCAGAEENAVSEFLKELRGWEAILKDDNHNIAKLLHPLVRAEEQVAAEDERKASQLSCQTARELRSMGIPCNVYYLFFDKWIPASLKNGKCCEVIRNVEIQIDNKDFQARSFEILLFGRLNGSSLPVPFVFRMNGGEVAAQVSMLEQMAQYRQGQKTRHRLGLSTQSVGKGVEGRDIHTAVVENDGLRKGNACEKSEHADDFYCPCGKDLDFTVIISNDHQLKCFVLKVIQVPADSGRKQEQLASYAPGKCDRGNSNNDSNKYCVSSSGGTSRKCENTVSDNKAAIAESSLQTKCCEFAETSSSLPRKVSDPSGSSPCPLAVHCPIYVSQSSTSDLGASPQNVCISSTESCPEGGLQIVEEPSGTLSKKKKKKRKAKRKGKVMVEICSTLDSTPGVSTINESLDSSTHTPVVECHCGGCGTKCCSGSVGDGALNSPLMEDVVRELSTCGDKIEGGLVNIFRREAQCAEHSRDDSGSSMMRTEAVKIGRSSLTAEGIVAEMVSDQLSMTLSKESSKCSFGKNAVLRHGEDFLPVGRGIPWSAACLATGTFENNLSQPFVGPIMVEMGLQKSSGLPARSSSDSRRSHFPSRELAGSLEAVRDADTLVDFSYTQFSARGGHNGSSGTGSRNGRSGTDGNGNRSQGRGSEDNRKGNTSGYHGGGQGSSSSNHGGGPGGSSTSGSSGGSGGGNWNRGGGRGSSGGSRDSRRSDDDGGNSNKEGDNDERYRNSFQAGSNGDAAADSVARKKGTSSLDSHGRKGVSGGVTGDQLMNGTSSSHGPLATSSSSGKENIGSWDELAQESVPPSQYKTGAEDGAPRTRMDQKFGSPPSRMNGFLHHELPPTKESNLIEKRDGVDHYQHGQVTNSLAQDSFVKVLKHSITNNVQNKDDDYDYLCSSSSRGSSKENRSFGTTVPPGQQDSLKGAWQKKICWDDHIPQPSYNNNKYVSEGSLQVGPSRGKLSLKSTKNGIQMRGSQSSDSDVVSSSKSSSAPSTPNGPIHVYDNFGDVREFNNNYTTRQTDGHAYQSTAVQAMTIAGEQQVPQARMQAANTAAVQQRLEARSAPEESSQRLTTWKSRKPSSSEQERPLVREKIVGDRERTTHWAQRWVPVEHKSGGASGKGSGTQSSSDNVRPVNGNRTESHEPQYDYVISKEIAGTGVGSTRGETPSSSSQSEALPSSTSPCKSLRRLQTFPSDNMNIVLRVSASEVGTLEMRESVASLSNERLCGHPEQQANLRGLLPRERTVDIPSTQAATQSTPGGHSTPVQSPTPGEQKNKLMLDDRSNKGSDSTVMAKPILPAAEEKSRKVVRTILEAVQSSCRDRRAAEGAVREVGCPMAEFEKVLGAVAPSFFPVVDSSVPASALSKMESPCVRDRAIRSRGNSINCDGNEFSICRCKLSHIPLNSIWQWYKEPSYYGVEVRAVDCKNVQKNGELEEEPFLAYFVPYLSGLQIFGYSSYGGSRRLGELASKIGNVDSPSSAQPKVFSGSDMLATLFPTPGKCDEALSHVAASCTTCGQKDSSLSDRDTPGLELLYEFYDTDVPQVRQPLFTKVQELVEGVSSINSYSRGRSTVLDELCLGDIHPASWFAVAWYPIYRISEAPLRATFLTYHSFDHFAPRSSLSCLMGEVVDVDDSISMPVVGLECYNLQGEPWLSMGGRFSEEATKASGRLTVNPTHCLENRISSLEAVAAGMAKGIPDEKSATSADGSSGVSKFRHSDYEFFVKRRR